MKAKKIISLLLVATITLSIGATVFAAETDNPKEEIVYAMLSNSGKVNDIYVVNSYEHLNKPLIDYGNYSAVRNLSTTDDLTISNTTISSSISKGKFYYEGKGNGYNLPWNIAITYTLDGKSITSEEILGKAGKAEIKIDVTQNKSVNPIFFEHYALSISTMLDTNKCSDIVSKDATIANAGESKSLTYMLLPKKEASYIITTTTTNFELGAISFNAIPFSMNVAIEGIDDISSYFKPLTKGISTLNEGSKTLKNGSSDLQSGIDELNKNSSSLTSGSREILKAIGDINSAIASMGDLTSSGGDLAQLNDACTKYQDGLTSAISGLTQISKDDEQTKQILLGLSQNTDPLVQGLIQVYNGKMAGINNIITGLNSLNDNFTLIKNGVKGITDNIGNISKLSSGLGILLEQYKNFDNGLKAYSDGFSKIADGYTKISNGIKELNSGINTLNNSTKNIDTEIKSKVDAALSAVSGGEFTPVSFSDKQNTNIKMVQFVIKADAIKAPAKVAEPTEKVTKTSFWEKLVNLFKKSEK
ncbi:MAG: hypothetical protein RR073_03065 [Clostridia bacterium]